VEMSDATFLRMIGLPADTSRLVLVEHYGPDFDVERFWMESATIFRSAGAGRHYLKPGASELLDLLDELHLPRAIATSSGHASAQRHLGEHGLTKRFNYIVARLMLNGQHYYLDASRPRLGFNKLGYDCYNGHARVIEPGAAGIELKPESLLEKEMTSVFMTNDANGNLTGNVQYAPGYYASYNIRTKIKDKGTDAYFAELKKEIGGDIEINDTGIDSVYNYEEPVAVKYHFKLPHDQADIWYFNPMLTEGWKENPFKSTERLYPVEMPYGIDQTFLLRMDVPPGYTIDELPKQLVVKLNTEDEGNFEYRVMESNGTISVRSRIRISRTFFAPEEYTMLREFFNLVVKKHNEQIVFKKKK
ncbi:MAG: DUF3858 domain-containing protein, partial [Sphingobacteriales bacterium]